MGIKEAIKKVVEKTPNKKYAEPLSSFKIVSQSNTNQIEPIYFWVLDFVQGLGFDVEKVTDNFTASPGSGQFSELNQKMTRMQEEGMKISGLMNQTIKSVLNLLYDLKEFKSRLKHYEDIKSDDEEKKKSAILALKQIWLDNVDMKRGRGSIHQMTNELGYTTLREAFMVADSLKSIEKMADPEKGLINDTIKRILLPRYKEFEEWIDYSRDELKKRYEVEKSYLRSQVETVKLQASWIRPYIEAADKLKQTGFEKDPALVNAFSTTKFELCLFGKSKAKPPEQVKKYNFKRDYFSCVVVDLKFRGELAQRDQRGNMAFGFGGKLEMTFDSYALNSEELKLIEKEMDSENLEAGLKFADIQASESLDQFKKDIEEILNENTEKEEKKKEKKSDDINPFSALFSGLGDIFSSSKKEKKKEVEEPKDVKKDNFYEEYLRNEAKSSAKGRLYTTYDVYKKSHGMASSPEDFDN